MKNEISDFIVFSDSTLKDTLIKMTSVHTGVQVIVDRDYYLLGVVSDGDVRRSLLQDISLSIPVEQVMNLNPKAVKTIEEAEKVSINYPFAYVIPIIDDENRLKGVYSTIHEKYYVENNALQKKTSTAEKSSDAKIKSVAVIPARGGSKRIPLKNLAKIGNDSLLSLAIKHAKDSKKTERIIVSTDSSDISNEARDAGVEVPWLRPDDLADDSSKTVDVLIHAVEMFKKKFDYLPMQIILLEPTAPFRSGSMIDDAVTHFEKHDADCLVSVNKIEHIYHPEELLTDKGEFYLRPYLEDRTFENRKLRGVQDPVYAQNGLVYVINTKSLLENRSIYGGKVLKYETDPSLFCDIDNPEDLEYANYLFKKRSP